MSTFVEPPKTLFDWRDVSDPDGVVSSIAYSLRDIPAPYFTRISPMIQYGYGVEGDEAREIIRENVRALVSPWLDYIGDCTAEVAMLKDGSLLRYDRGFFLDHIARYRVREVEKIAYTLSRWNERRELEAIDCAVRAAVYTTVMTALACRDDDDFLARMAGEMIEREATDILAAAYFTMDVIKPYRVLSDANAYYAERVKQFTVFDVLFDQRRDLQRVRVVDIFSQLMDGTWINGDGDLE